MNKESREFLQKMVTCPLCRDVANYKYLRVENDNRRVYECISNKEHIVEIDEDIFWSKKA